MRIVIIVYVLFLFIPSCIAFIRIPSATMFLICLSLLFFILPFYVYRRKKSSNRQIISSKLQVSEKLVWALIFLYFIIDFSASSEAIWRLFNGEYLEYGVEMALSRYDGTNELKMTAQLRVLLFLFLSWLLPLTRISKLILISLYCLFVIVEFSQLARTSVILSGVSIVAVTIVNNRAKVNNLSLNGTLKYLVITGSISFTLFMAVALGRVYNNDDKFDIVLEKVGKYTLANYDALAVWAKGYSYDTFGLGQNTVGVLGVLYGRERVLGAFPPTKTDFGVTNLYTVCRSVYEDFWVLSMGFWLLMGYWSVKLFTKRKILRQDLIYLPLPLVFLLYWFYSPFYFNSYTVSYLLFLLVVKVIPE